MLFDEPRPSSLFCVRSGTRPLSLLYCSSCNIIDIILIIYNIIYISSTSPYIVTYLISFIGFIVLTSHALLLRRLCGWDPPFSLQIISSLYISVFSVINLVMYSYIALQATEIPM